MPFMTGSHDAAKEVRALIQSLHRAATDRLDAQRQASSWRTEQRRLEGECLRGFATKLDVNIAEEQVREFENRTQNAEALVEQIKGEIFAALAREQAPLLARQDQETAQLAKARAANVPDIAKRLTWLRDQAGATVRWRGGVHIAVELPLWVKPDLHAAIEELLNDRSPELTKGSLPALERDLDRTNREVAALDPKKRLTEILEGESGPAKAAA